MKEINEIVGREAGPTSIVMIGVHGNEKCGLLAMEKIWPTLKIDRGRVLLVVGNPLALQQNKRFVEDNLNRMFKESASSSYEYRRAQKIKKYLDQADALLDIHSSNNPVTQPFAICEDNAKDVVKYLPVNFSVSGLDYIQPGGTDYYMNQKGGIGICVECGYHTAPEAITLAEKCFFSFLKARNHIKQDLNVFRQRKIKVYSMYITETDNLVLKKCFSDFEEIEKNQLIAYDGDREVRADRDSVILFAYNPKKRKEEAFLLGEYEN